MGGQQFWTDVYYHVGWRIQHNLVTDHYRLLDPDDHRHAWGTYDDCISHFATLRAQLNLSYDDKPVVFLIKGLGGMGSSFRGLRSALEADGYHVAYVAYPSTRQSVADHADDITRLLNGLEGVRDISFVAHSMGGLVMRRVLATPAPWQEDMTIRGLAMVGTPNRGASLAEIFAENEAFKALTTDAGQDLRPHSVEALPPVTIRHCLIIGSTNGGKGTNPLIRGDDDGVVGVAEAYLSGSDDILIVDGGYHRTLPSHDETVAGVKRFLLGQRCDDPGNQLVSAGAR
jgi:pimeloyl-ACP methyl ester carboxylesterase